ncbi:MAG: zinc ABC transporter substrate-binding protein [Betaproteobacteria bacterium]|nr:zinc ABC transporter substrate-binding protein [Betaproteobacteria bacterium]
MHDPEIDIQEQVIRGARALGARDALAVIVASVLAAAPGPGAAQGQAEGGKLQVVATSTDLKSLVERVGGDRVEVECLAAPDQDPHALEVKPAQLARLRRAALLVRVGLDHEPWLARLKTGVPVVDASRGLRLLQSETPRLRVERKAHVHAFGNTHYWLDPQNARPITAAILEALANLSPADRPRFAANREAFVVLLDAKIRQWTAALEPFHGARVVVIHDSWAYFAERFGLSIVAAVEPTPGVPPSPAELAALFKRMRETGVRVLIADPHSNPSLVRQVAEASGARTVTLHPSVTDGDYLSLFDSNVQRLVSLLGGR